MRSPLLSPTSLSSPHPLDHGAFWLRSASWVIASIAGAMVALANVPVGSWSSELPPSAAETSPQSPGDLQSARKTEALAARVKSGCQSCGVVENIRRVAVAGSTPAVYEFTIRLRDGSTRVSNDASAAMWRVGDSIMLIGGDKPGSEARVSL